MPFAATWMDLEIIILSEVNQSKMNSNDITYTYNLKYDTNELIQKTNNFVKFKNKIKLKKKKKRKPKQTHGPRKQIYGYQRGQRMGRDKLGIWDQQT